MGKHLRQNSDDNSSYETRYDDVNMKLGLDEEGARDVAYGTHYAAPWQQATRRIADAAETDGCKTCKQTIL